MILKKITINNYRSIDELSFDIEQLDDNTYTYGLVGVNEAGKSTILKAIALKDGLIDMTGQELPLGIDFRNKELSIIVKYLYLSDKKEIGEYKKHLKTQLPDVKLAKIDLSQIEIDVFFNHSNPNQINHTISIINIAEDDENKEEIEDQLKQIILEKTHRSIFWTSEDKYLITEPINLVQFAANPEGISVPLKNCFLLAGIDENKIQSKINSLVDDSTEVEDLQNNLGEAVTKHIKKAWPKHPIEITFLITDGLIHFHVKDLKVKGRAKVANQRSDGFRQFISFLLTISAESEKKQLANSILLLDEPETHLHPQAQENLLQELIKITKGGHNNIVFFATHSNYMIDKDDFSRNYRIIKPNKTDVTDKKRFDKKNSTYASVTYEAFEISSTDYHNELYGRIEYYYKYNIYNKAKENKKIKYNFDEYLVNNIDRVIIKQWQNDRCKCKKKKYTLQTYIRHQIHHPENSCENKNLLDNSNLKKSIKQMLVLLSQISGSKKNDKK